MLGCMGPIQMHEFTVLCRATTYVDFGERGLTKHKKASTKQIGINKKTKIGINNRILSFVEQLTGGGP